MQPCERYALSGIALGNDSRGDTPCCLQGYRHLDAAEHCASTRLLCAALLVQARLTCSRAACITEV